MIRIKVIQLHNQLLMDIRRAGERNDYVVTQKITSYPEWGIRGYDDNKLNGDIPPPHAVNLRPDFFDNFYHAMHVLYKPRYCYRKPFVCLCVRPRSRRHEATAASHIADGRTDGRTDDLR